MPGDIVVTASYGIVWGWSDYYTWFDTFGNSYGQSFFDLGASAGFNYEEGNFDHTADAKCADGAAIDIMNHIDYITKNVDKRSDSEYGSLIVRNSDGTYGAGNDQIETNYSGSYVAIERVANGSTVEGIAHNHVWNSSDYNFNFVNRYPSDEDWQAAEALIAQGANSSIMSLYIKDGWGQTHEFSYADKDMYTSLSRSEMMRGDGLRAPTPCK